MGNCIYCGKPAGIFKSRHKECEKKHYNLWETMIRKTAETAISGNNLSKLKDELNEIAKEDLILINKINDALILGWEEAVSYFLEDGNLEFNEEKKIVKFANYFNLNQTDLDKRGMYTKYIQGLVLRDIMEGKIPKRFITQDALPFNFQKNENLIWVFKNVSYYEKKIRKEYVGGNQGISIRIAKGIYYRVGYFKGYPIEREELICEDNGILAITDKHLYFQGNKKIFRVPYSKIISITPFSDGIGIQKDGVTAKPQYFLTGDGWFIYNLVINLAREQLI